MLYTTEYLSPLGNILLASDGESLCGLWFFGQKHFPAELLSEAGGNAAVPLFGTVKAWLDRYFSGEAVSPYELPLAPCGSSFRKSVWEKLLEIPRGSTRSYGQIARELSEETGKLVSARAVGGAVGANPISVIIPCHRVIGADGNLTGYAGGLERKTYLLELEGAYPAPLSTLLL